MYFIKQKGSISLALVVTVIITVNMNTWESLDSIKIPLIFWTIESQTQHSDFGVLLQLFISFSYVESKHILLSFLPQLENVLFQL